MRSKQSSINRNFPDFSRPFPALFPEPAAPCSSSRQPQGRSADATSAGDEDRRQQPRSAPARTAAACPAMPAASSAISQPVTENSRETGSAPERQCDPPVMSRDGDAVEIQHYLDALAQHSHDRHGKKRATASRHLASHRLHLGRQPAAVACHRDLVPTQHQHPVHEDTGVENLLSGARHAPRPTTPQMAARTMPTISPASRTSWSAMIRLVS